ncbi:diol dehydratase small subunit [Iocasia frigidifontis]|uniref:Diol dehydratase small subunit n=1 Tax=Iocasia fonsfrigidae TaxID=2682810 RepID=A0A8A7KH20_9FIRM|nr:diol dehydratase small subunit [Iocasia fonsfrigidae]QTL98809.1 diol dehydratase small subunit [Iocasia fonsfrigidae]
MDKDMIESIVRNVVNNLDLGDMNSNGTNQVDSGDIKLEDYPLGKKRPDLVKTPSGKTLDELTLEKILSGEIDGSELRITVETLKNQAKIARKVNREQFARNLERAAELTKISDERILEIYNALRPYRSTKGELLEIADELEEKYGAKVNAGFVREAAEIYEKRKRLRGDR